MFLEYLPAGTLLLTSAALFLFSGSFPKFALRGRVCEILTRLSSCLEITKDTEKWAEGRRDAIKAITAIVATVGVSREQGKKKALYQSRFFFAVYANNGLHCKPVRTITKNNDVLLRLTWAHNLAQLGAPQRLSSLPSKQTFESRMNAFSAKAD